jgi:hypothetical protein
MAILQLLNELYDVGEVEFDLAVLGGKMNDLSLNLHDLGLWDEAVQVQTAVVLYRAGGGGGTNHGLLSLLLAQLELNSYLGVGIGQPGHGMRGMEGAARPIIQNACSGKTPQMLLSHLLYSRRYALGTHDLFFRTPATHLVHRHRHCLPLYTSLRLVMPIPLSTLHDSYYRTLSSYRLLTCP